MSCKLDVLNEVSTFGIFSAIGLSGWVPTVSWGASVKLNAAEKTIGRECEIMTATTVPAGNQDKDMNREGNRMKQHRIPQSVLQPIPPGSERRACHKNSLDRELGNQI